MEQRQTHDDRCNVESLKLAVEVGVVCWRERQLVLVSAQV